MNRTFLVCAATLSLLATVTVRAAAPSCGDKAPDSLLTTLLRQAPGLRLEILRMAVNASDCAATHGLVARRNLLTVIDYSLPSSQPRLFTFDLSTQKLVFRELVAHGKSSGGDKAGFFSNSPGSLASSLGLYVTADPYYGNNGRSLRLRGLEQGINDRAWDRAIVLHGASYVSAEAVKVLGRLGRSWGCPAVRREIAGKVIETLRGGTAIFAYYPDKNWLANSAYIRRAAKPPAATSVLAVGSAGDSAIARQ